MEIVKKIKSLLAKATDEIETVRGQISALKKEHRDLECRPSTKEEITARIQEGVEGLAARYQNEHLSKMPIVNGRAQPNHLAHSFPRRERALPEFFCWLWPEQVAEKMTEAAQTFASTLPGGLASEERNEQLALIETKLAELERREERLILESEAAGMRIARRADATPSVVLGER